MRIRRIKVLLAKGWYVAVWCVSYSLFSMFCGFASAKGQDVTTAAVQDNIKSGVIISGVRPQAGDTISGWVHDSEGPLMFTNVVERDSKDRIVSHAVTDREGHFSLKIVDPQNRIQVSYVGYDMAECKINGNVFVITMEEKQDSVETGGVQIVNGLAIPLREAAGFVETIDMNEFTELAYGVPRPQFEEPWSKYLNKNTELTVFLDGIRVNLSYEQKKSFINENTPMDIESLAGLVGVKKSKLKAVRLIGPQSEATAIEVVTKKYYRQLRREGRLDSSYKNLDVF